MSSESNGHGIVLLGGNGEGRNPLSRGKDYVTVEKVQQVVNTLLQNDKSLDENQKRIVDAQRAAAETATNAEEVVSRLVLRVEELERQTWRARWRRLIKRGDQ